MGVTARLDTSWERAGSPHPTDVIADATTNATIQRVTRENTGRTTRKKSTLRTEAEVGQSVARAEVRAVARVK